MSGRRPLPVRASSGVRESGRVGERGNPATSVARTSHSPTPPLSHSAVAADAELSGLWRALGDVMDPEFPISIVDLGLVYAVRRAGEAVEVDLTFTATACPCMDFIHDDVRERLAREPGVGEVRIRDVWDPPWTRERISAEGRTLLRRHGVAA